MSHDPKEEDVAEQMVQDNKIPPPSTKTTKLIPNIIVLNYMAYFSE